MIDGGIKQYFGYAQIHGAGYWEEQTIDRSLDFTDIFKSLPEKVTGLDAIIPRLESFALASEGNLSTGVLVIGIDPKKEQELTGIADKLIAGTYLNEQENEAIIAEGLAKKLNLNLSDTLILISQGYRGVNAAGKYAIRGIFKMGLPDLNKRLVYLPLKTAAYFLGAEERVTTLVLGIKNKELVPETLTQVKNQLAGVGNFELMDWQELMPELVETRVLKEGGNYVFIGILYLLIAFAIFGTILMMTKERSYEFGVLTAIGMRRQKLFSIVWLETILVGIVGALIGILISIPLVYYLKVNPLTIGMMGEEAAAAYEKFGLQDTLPAAFEFQIFLSQALIIFLITCLLALYPFFSIRSLQPTEAMKA